MESIQFVLEAPQLTPGKKRARLVTSCDHCRLKKVKCIQIAPTEKCEACANAQVPCRFRDRKRYFAERDRVLSGVNSSEAEASKLQKHAGPTAETDHPPYVVPSQRSRSVIGRKRRHELQSPYSLPASSSRATLLASLSDPQPPHVADTHSSNESATLPETTPSMTPTLTITSLNSAPSTADTSASDRSSHPPPQQESLGPLFDPRSPDRPHANLMAYFIQAFLDNLHSSFPFLYYDVLIQQFLTQTIPPLTGCCIAALSAQYVQIPEVTERGVTAVQDAYCKRAESILSASKDLPSLDTLHGLILFAWTEHRRKRESTFTLYTQMAVSMAWKLGLPETRLTDSTQDEYERRLHQTTWACVTHLSMMANERWFADSFP
ncbi:hypothetical protein K474DRAFT_1703508 [Panus rudis PR-1116 ss-1]|nr:hypothetical protein K474DRAFT_1703508 [Panus rudis PR-1116 ss-1]